MAKIIAAITGVDGELELREDRVVIHRKGLWCAFKFGINARREIPLNSILEVNYKAAGFQVGQIDFIIAGQQSMTKSKFRGEVKHGAVQFKRKQNAEMEQFKEKVFETLAAYRKPAQ